MGRSSVIFATAFIALLLSPAGAAGQSPGGGKSAPAPAAKEAADKSAPNPVEPPSPLEAEPPAKGFGRVRLTAWAGWVNASVRKDTKLLEGDRLSWTDDLGGSPVFLAPALRGEFKVRRKVYGFFEFAWVEERGYGTADPGGVRFDGETFAGGARLTASVTRLFFDMGLMAWGTVEEEYRIAFALGVKYQALTQVLSESGGVEAVETTEALFPYVETRGEVKLSDTLRLEGWGRASLFTISHREVVTEETVITQHVDWAGNVVLEEVTSSGRSRYLLTQINGLIEIGAGMRWDFTSRLSLTGGFRFAFLNAERTGGDMSEDMEWRTLGIELGLEARF